LICASLRIILGLWPGNAPVTTKELADTMTNAIVLPPPSSPERSRLLSVDLIRRRALERLYRRRFAVEELIHSLEEYQLSRQNIPGECVQLQP